MRPLPKSATGMDGKPEIKVIGAVTRSNIIGFFLVFFGSASVLSIHISLHTSAQNEIRNSRNSNVSGYDWV